MNGLTTQKIPDSLEERIIWLLGEVQSPLLYVVGISITAALLVSLQTLFRARPFKCKPADNEEEEQQDERTLDALTPPSDTQKDLYIVLDSWYSSKYLIAIVILMAGLGSLIYRNIDDPLLIHKIFAGVLYLILLGVCLFFWKRICYRYLVYRRIRSEVSLEQRMIASSLDVVIVGLSVFFAWLLYMLMMAIWSHRDPSIAFIILTLPIAMLAGLFSVTRLVVELIRETPVAPSNTP